MIDEPLGIIPPPPAEVAVPIWILRHPGLSAPAVRVWAHVAAVQSDGGVSPTTAETAEALPMPIVVVDAVLRELRTHGAICALAFEGRTMRLHAAGPCSC